MNRAERSVGAHVKLRSKLSADRVWLVIFSIWSVLLSGVLTRWIGGPGVLQWVHLEQLLKSKQDKWVEVETRMARLEEERRRLEKSSPAQELEIRRVLGYAADDELIFDFSGS